MQKLAFSFTDELQQEHVSLLDLLTDLDNMTEPGERVKKLLRCLWEMQLGLRRHFHFEEQGGYMSQILDDAPHLHHAAQALLAEHGRIAGDLEALITSIACLRPEDHVTASLQAQLRQWVQLVRDHETRENRLTQQACNQDIGADD